MAYRDPIGGQLGQERPQGQVRLLRDPRQQPVGLLATACLQRGTSLDCSAHVAGVRRNDLTDAQWRRLEPLLPPERPRTGRPNHSHRTILNGILWILRTGAPWRDLPDRYGPVGTVSSRF
jgi:hypothetical protein